MKVNALQIRQSFGKILKKLLSGEEPIVIEKAKEPVAVLISLKTFQQRFIDHQTIQQREILLKKFKESATKPKFNSLHILRDLRYGPQDH